MITKNLNYATNIQAVHELDSDHYPIEITIDLAVTFEIPKARHNFVKTD